jgi:hypothetical protein
MRSGDDRGQEVALFLLKLEEEGLTDSEQEELARLLKISPEARHQLVAHAMMTSELTRGLESIGPKLPFFMPRRLPGQTDPTRREVAVLATNARGSTSASRWIGFGAAAALVLVLGVGVLLYQTRQPPGPAGTAVSAGSDRSTASPVEGEEAEERPLDQATMRELRELAAAFRVARGGRREPPPRLARVAPGATGSDGLDTFATLAALPSEHLVYLRAGKPDARGMFGGNETAWTCAGSQRATLNTLMAGAVLGKPEWVEEGWRVIEATFAQQTTEGHFGEQETRNHSRASCAVMFGGTLIAALDVLERSRFGPAYATRIAALQPALARLGGFLSRPERLEQLSRNRGTFVDLTIPTLAALAGLATRLEDSELRRQTVALADVVVSRLRPDGTFEFDKGFDSVRQAHGLVLLHQTLPHLEDHERFRAAVDLAGRWVASRILPEGDIDLRGNRCAKPPEEGPSRCMLINRAEIRRGLLMHAQRFDPAAHPLADRMLDRQLGRSR